MKKIILYTLASCCSFAVYAQSPRTEMYDLIKKFLYDSTGYENVGDWSVGKPAKFPVKWKADKIEMSQDTSINFYRRGTAEIMLNGRALMQAGQPVTWNIMLKGPRMGYSSFSIICSPSDDLHPKYTLDSVFGNKPYTAKLLRSCDSKILSGYYYYEVKLPKKDVAFIKLSWISINNKTAIRLDCFDSFSNYAVKLDCPR